MTLEQQVCSLDLAKRLHELGVKQESLWVWEFADGVPSNLNAAAASGSNVYAYSVAELGEMLPTEIINEASPEHRVHRLICEKTTQDMKGTQVEGWHVFYICKSCRGRLGSQWDVEEADARAKMLVYLLENHLITP